MTIGLLLALVGSLLVSGCGTGLRKSEPIYGPIVSERTRQLHIMAGYPLPAASPGPDVQPFISIAGKDYDLLAFVSTAGKVYIWYGHDAKLVHTPPEGWAVSGLALSPKAGNPYLAVAETRVSPQDPAPARGGATKVTIVNVQTAGSYQAFPLAPGDGVQDSYTSLTDVYGLQWSSDGGELFINCPVPVVLSVADRGATVVWDLSAIRPSGTEARAPLLAPDFSRVAHSSFSLAGDTGEELWVLDRPDSGALASAPRRISEGNIGGYPVAWLGSAADGSDPDEPAFFVLVQLGEVSTGGGTATGLAVVDTLAGAPGIWYPEGKLVHSPLLVDLKSGRVLISLFHSVTGLDGRVFWHRLDGIAPESPVPQLDGKLTGPFAVKLSDGSAVVLARQYGPESQGPREYWVVAPDSSARMVGSAPEGAEAYLINGTVGGRALIVTITADDDTGVSRAALYRVDHEAGNVEQVNLVELVPEADG